MFVAQVLFQFKNREGFLGIVEHGSNGGAGTVTGDLAPTVLLRDARFPAQKRDERLIDVSVPDALADEGGNWLGLGRRGFVHRNIQKPGGVFGQDLSSLWYHHISIFPAYASYSQPPPLLVP